VTGDPLLALRVRTYASSSASAGGMAAAAARFAFACSRMIAPALLVSMVSLV